ncbi:hypothetical protein ACFO1B_14285 [Dactylosporangium siamense]|uniref:Uncharacterized protein n=1 Tax=Dactylosporangium siamense TaxID=685454 RepID=A0A919PHK9_9ACTN|nr:hypothetical protein [Dactylosporangium siamense]GIG45000.1 hypothetical protein Dsi01nite_030410 [Dactylosporangium siamense]
MFTSNKRYWIAEEVPATASPDYSNGLINPFPGAAAVITGTDTGNVGLSMEFYDTAPPLVTDGWDEVADFTIWAHDGILRIVETVDRSDPYPLLAFQGPGGYRIRLHARDRDTAFDLAVETPIEHHLIQVWPTTQDEAEPVENHKLTDVLGSRRRSRPR